ncbi:hypothetical protein ACDT12_13050, partial [Staphylococcus aureus]
FYSTTTKNKIVGLGYKLFIIILWAVIYGRSILPANSNVDLATQQFLQQQQQLALKANFLKELEKMNKTGQQSLLEVIASLPAALAIAPTKVPNSIDQLIL